MPDRSELGLAFAEACRRDTPKSSRDLQCATVNLVGRLKADGFPPERVIVAIKDAITRDGCSKFPPSLIDAEGAVSESAATPYRRVFGWYLDAYYGASVVNR